MNINVGAAKVDITPPVGIWMTGFAARTSPATGIHDPLFAKAVVFEDGADRTCIVCLDIIQPDEAILARVRFGVEQSTGIPQENLLINSTHTHSGPTTYRFNGMGEYDTSYCDVLSRKIVTAVQQACDSVKDADVSYGVSPVTIGANRRTKNKDGKISMTPNGTSSYDPNVYVLRAERTDAPPIILMSHAAHPVILGSDNLQFSADFCGFACSHIESKLGPDTIAMYMQGCCGDINADRGDGTFKQAQAVGEKLAEAVVDTDMGPLEGDGIRSGHRVLQLPLMPPPSVGEATEQLKQLTARSTASTEEPWKKRVAFAMENWGQRILACARNGDQERTQSMEIHGIRIGDFALLGTEAETFIDYALQIQQRSPQPHTVVLGYTNGCIGYLPTKNAYPEGGYEVDDAIRYYGLLMMKPESEQLVIEESLKLLEQLD